MTSVELQRHQPDAVAPATGSGATGNPGPAGPGTALAERYELRTLVAHGGMADVYQAFDHRLDRMVAVKLLRSGSPEAPRFRAEIAVLASMQHRNVLHLFDAGEHDGQPYAVVELCDGTLGELMAEGPIDRDRVAEIGRDIAGALEHLHASGVVHRDIKPGNVLLAADGRALLADLGIALVADRDRLTSTGLSIGTPTYLAPEQCVSSTVGPAADIYSLGLVLAEALTSAPVYAGSPSEVLARKLAQAAPLPDGIPAEWEPLLRSMTALDPAERPGATEIAIRLCEMQADPDVGRSRTEGLALDQPRQQVEATAALVPVAGDGPAAMPLAEVEADQSPSTDGENDDAVRRRDGDRLSPRRMASRRARLSAYVAAAAALVAAVALLTGGFRSGPISVRQSPKTPSTLVTVPDGEQNEADIIEHDTEKPSTTTSSAPSSTTVIASVDTGSGTGAEGGASTSATGSSPSTSTPTTAPATTTTSEPEAPTTTEPPPSTVGADSPSTTVAATPGGD